MRRTIRFEIAGKGRIIAVDSGGIRSHEGFRNPVRKAYQGRRLVLIQSTGEPGTTTPKATAARLAGGTILIDNSWPQPGKPKK